MQGKTGKQRGGGRQIKAPLKDKMSAERDPVKEVQGTPQAIPRTHRRGAIKEGVKAEAHASAVEAPIYSDSARRMGGRQVKEGSYVLWIATTIRTTLIMPAK